MKDIVLKYRSMDYSCSETIIQAFNEKRNLNLSTETIRSTAAFSGGMLIKNTCGIVTSGLMILSVIFTKDRAHNSDKLKIIAKEFQDNFNMLYTNNICSDIKANYVPEGQKCDTIIIDCAVMLDKLIDKYL